MPTHRPAKCAQCSITTGELTPTEYGPLCPTCAYRQAEHDEARARFDHLTPSTFGFLSDTE